MPRTILSRSLKSFIQECINDYAKEGELYVQDLPDFVRHEFAARIMIQDNAWAAEAVGPDNKHWERRMFPTLVCYLTNSTDKDEAIEFTSTWRDCVTDYMNDYMQELIDGNMG